MKSLRRKSPSRANKKFFSIFGLVTLVVLSLGLLAGTLFIKYSLDNRQQASSQPTATVTWQARDIGTDTMKMQLMLNTKDYTLAGVQVVGKITGVKKDDVSFLSNDGFPAEIVFEKLNDSSDGVKFSFTKFAYLDAQKPLTTRGGEQPMAILQIKKRDTQSVVFSIDQTASSLPNTADGKSYATWPGPQSVNFASATGGTSSNQDQDRDKKTCNQNCATDTECRSVYTCYKGQCRLPKESEREDAECRQIPDKGLERSCNQYCADKNECAAGYDCYFNRCRNPKNLTAENCSNPVRVQPSTTPTSTTTPRSTTTTPKGSIVANVAIANPSPSALATSLPSYSPTTYASPITSGRFSSPSPKASPKPTTTTQLPQATRNSSSGSTSWKVVTLVVSLSILGGLGFALWKILSQR